MIALAQFLAVLHLVGKVRVLLRPLGELAQEFVHRRAQLLHELVDFLVAGAAFERILQRLLRLAKTLLGGRQVAVLDAERDLPEIGDDVAQRLVVLGRLQPRARAHQHQIVGHVVERVLRPERDRVHQVEHVPLLVGVERQDAALLDHRPGERIGERPLRQDDRLGLAPRLMSGVVDRLQRQLGLRAGPDMLGEVARRLGGGALCAAAGQGRAAFRAPG